MTLRPGALLGPYEIQRLIGRGGMGEVYHATDTRLQRPVAIKVLPEELTASAAARDRLQREARTASVLNHPNICTIYDVGMGVPMFIAMELLQGESLQQRLQRDGRLRVDELLDIAIAIAEGLGAAHAHAFIHRDIKPANIFLTSHGPKLLDFGLAKNLPALAAGWSEENTRPADALLTDSGVTVGTAAYMSPEQLRGKEIDARTDIFSLGLVLYEMATGRPAFTGKTGAAISGAILYEQPVPPLEIAGEIPIRLNELILKALEKDPDDRYQTVGDLRADLRRLRRELGSSAHPQATGASASSHTARFGRISGRSSAPSRRRLWAVTSVAVVIALLAAAFFARRSGDSSAGSSISIIDLQVARLTSTGDAVRPALAPDGNYLAFIRRQNGRDGVYVRQMATSATAEIVMPVPNVTLWGTTVSPDGGFVDYVRRSGGEPFELWRVPFLGGTPRRMIDRVTSPIGWSPDGRQFAFIRADFTLGTTGVVVADADGGNQRVLAERKRPAQFVSLAIAARPSIAPAWSPDGRSLAVAGAGAGPSPAAGDVAFINVGSGAVWTTPLPSNEVRGLVWFSDRVLILDLALPGAPVQLHQLSYPDGAISPLTRDVNDYDGISLSADRRTLVSSRRERRTDLSILDATGRTVESGPDITPITAQSEAVTINWIGDRVLYGNWSWTPGRSPQQLLKEAGNTTASPDGRTLVFGRENSLWKSDSDGNRQVQLAAGEAYNPVVTRDNRWIIYLSSRAGQQSLWRVSVDGGEPSQLIDEFVGAPGADISPDGRQVVMPTRDSQLNRPTALICDLPDCTRRRVIPAFASTRLRWTPDGTRIAYVEPDMRTNIWTVPIGGGKPVQLTHFEERFIVDFDWSSDGKRLVVGRRLETNDIVVLKDLRRE